MNFYTTWAIFFMLMGSSMCLSQCPEGWDPKPCECLVTGAKVNVFCRKNVNGDDVAKAFSSLPVSWTFDGFYLFDSSIQSLPGQIFGKAAFRHFKFSDNELTTVDEDAFKGSEETAESIFFESNRLSNFNYASLRYLRKLYSFMATDDKHFSSVPDDAFGDNPILSFINLRNNTIKSIGKRAFAKLPHLLSLNLDENEIEYFDANSLSLPIPTKNQRTIVYLAKNNITVNSFHESSLFGLFPERLDLSENRLTTLPQQTFEKLLDFLAAKYPRPIGFLGKLVVTGNPFVCDQSISWLIEKLNQYKSNIDGFKCTDGTHLKDLIPDIPLE